MMKKLGILFAFVALTGLTSAFPFTATIEGPSAVSMLEGMTVTVPLNLHNVDFEKHSITVAVKTDSGFIEAKPIIKKLTLNGYESTTLGIDIHAEDDADHDTYEVLVKVDADGQVAEVPIVVYVGSNPYLTLSSFTKTVCGNEWVDDISFSVKNNSNEDTDVLVKAEHPILFPTFDEETLSLENGETQIIDLELNVSPQNVGEYEGTIFAQNDKVLVARTFSVKVNDCPTPTEKVISLTLLKKPKDLTKLQTTFFPITLKNLTSQTQEVFVSVESVILVDALTVHLTSKETLTVDLLVKPDLSVKAGTYPVKITAYASGYSVSQTVNMKVLPLSYIQAETVSTIYELSAGETKTMQFVVNNLGDVSQTLTTSMLSASPGITYTFTPSTFTVASGKSQVVSLSVAASSNVSIDSVSNAILINGKPPQSIPLVFELVKSDDSSILEIDVLSGPDVLTLNQGESKEFEIVVENPTDESIQGIVFKLVGVKGSGLILIPKDSSEVLAPHQTKTMVFTLKASEKTKVGAYSPILVMESADAVQTVPFTVIVNESGFLSGLTGFFILLGSNASMLGLILILILVGLWVIGKVTRKTPAWASKWVK